MSTINGAVQNVTLGSGGVTSPLTITSTGRVTNAGTSSAVSNAYGVILNDGTILTSGLSSGTPTSGINQGGATLAVTNTGLISGDRTGIYNLVVGRLSVTNTASGTITSQVFGVSSYGTLSVMNAGVISGPTRGIVDRSGGASIGNTGSISGQVGIEIFGGTGTVTNSGAVSGGAYGVALEAGGNITNQTGGRISAPSSVDAAQIGVKISGGAGLVSNAGILSGGTGITFSGAFADTLTLASGGTIIGTAGTAASLGDGDDTLLIQSGAVAIQGKVDGGAGTDVLTFGAGGGTLTGTGADFEGFEQITVAPGGTWTLAGTVTIGAGTNVVDSGRLNVTGALTNAGTINVNSYDALFVTGRLTNTGVILATSGFAVDGGAGAVITNSGRIADTGGVGIRLTGGGGTVVTSGTISGSAGAVSFAGGNDTLVVRSGYAFGGTVVATGTGNAVLLQGESGSAVTATLGSLQLSGFQTVGFAAGGTNYATLKLTSNTVLPGTIASFVGTHDTVDLSGLTHAGGATVAQFDPATQHLAVVGQNGTVTLQLDNETYSGIAWVAESDGAGGTAVRPVAVVAQTISGSAAGQSVNDNATRQPFSAVTVGDTNTPTQSDTATIVLRNGGAATDADGNLSGTGLTKTGTGTYSLSAASAAALTTALRALVFTPTADQVAPGSTVTTAFQLTVTDGFGQSATNASTSVVAASVNDAPAIGGAVAGQNVADTGTRQPFSTVTIADPDVGANEATTITVTAGGVASDADGLLSGTGLTKTGTGTYALAAGSPAAVQAALRAVTFTPTQDQVPPGNTVTTGFTLSVSDGSAPAVTNSTTTVVATSANSPPSIGGTAAGQMVADTSTTHPFSAVTIADPDSGASETVTITLAAGGAASDANGTLSGTGLTRTGNGTYTLAADTPAVVEAELHALVFTPTPNQVAPGGTVTTGLTLSVSDGIAAAVTDGTTTVVATSINDAPVLSGGGMITVLQGGTTRITTADLSSTDPDNADGQLVYTVTGTTHGDVLLNNAAATSFTQADLAQGRVGFRQDGSAGTSAGFTVSLTDGIAPGQAASVTASVDLAPTVASIGPSVSGPTNVTTLTETVTFSEAVTGVDAADFTVTTTSGSAIAHVASVTGSGATYTVTLDQVAGDGTIRLDLNASATGIQDAAGNPAGGFTGGGTTALDHTAPAVTISAIAGDDVLNGAEARTAIMVTGTAAGAEDGQLVTVAVKDAAGTTTFASTAATVANGAWSLSFPAGTGTQLPDRTYLVTADVSDRVGNAAVEAQRTLLVDKFADQAPSATLAVDGTPDGVVNAAEARAVAFTVAGLDGDAMAVARFTDGTHTASAAVAADGTFAIDLSGFTGSVTSSLAITDIHANTASAAGNTVAFDSTAPVLTVSGVSGATNLVEHVVSGTIDLADAGGFVTIRDGADLLGTVASDAQGQWALPFTYAGPSNHSYHLTASETDAAGNTGLSGSFDFTVDFTPNQGLFGTIAHDASGIGGQVFEIYEGLLGRAPDALGFENAIDVVGHGESLVALTRDFLASPEYVAAHGLVSAESDAGFVSELYQVVLGRAGEAAGTANWLSALAGGTSREEVALDFVLSSESLAQDAPVLGAGVFVPDPIASDVARLYDGVFDRAPDAGGLQSWTNAIRGGASETAVAQNFLTSDEYAAGHTPMPSSDAFITSLYEGALGRAPEPEGLAIWQTALAQGASRAAVALAIAESPEAKVHHLGDVEQGFHLT